MSRVGKPTTNKPVDLLDTTLRDGSYSINYQFTARDTEIISSELEKAGVKFIEVGHGIGMGASRKGLGEAAETDEAYLIAAAKSIKKAKFGMFFIPGIGELSDIDMAAQHGMNFIRIGTNVTEVAKSEKFIERAKKHGMFVSANFMKSYAMDPKQFSEVAQLTQKFGSDLLCIVDSAGGMLHDEVKSYFEAVKNTCDISLGFHGHNNLGLAVSNSLLAVDMGASVIDCTLQGMGRSAGNAPTEMIVAALMRKGIDVGVDLIKAMDAGEKYIRSLMRRKGWGSLDVVSGYAQFHSSYMGLIRRYSSQYNIDPRELIIEVCKVNKVDATPDMVEQIAKQVRQASNDIFTARFDFDEYVGNEQNQTKK